MDRLLFGDNQFFGVNHMSEEKARSQSMRFRDTQAIIDVLDKAYDNGIRTFMCTTCLLYTSPSPRDLSTSRMPSSA